MEFCKIPNFGTVTMKTPQLVTMATIMFRKKSQLQTEEIWANIPAKHQDFLLKR